MIQFHIILVAPARAENVGAAARAMKTMGFTSLRVVNSDAHLQPPARWLAHGAGELLDNCQHFDTLQAALHDVEFVVAATARSRAKYHYYCTPAQLLSQLQERSNWSKSIALVFGREDAGLTNVELELADLLTGVPMVTDYPSLNLGQAVMVYCYQLSGLLSHQPVEEMVESDNGQLLALHQRAARLFDRLNVSDDHKLVEWVDQRLGFLTRRDTAMLHRLLNDIEKELPEIK